MTQAGNTAAHGHGELPWIALILVGLFALSASGQSATVEHPYL
jgi:hypothetical protein